MICLNLMHSLSGLIFPANFSGGQGMRDEEAEGEALSLGLQTAVSPDAKLLEEKN